MTKKIFKKTAKKCPKCGCNKFDVGAGSGPHVARIECANCKRFMWWLQKTEYKFLANH